MSETDALPDWLTRLSGARGVWLIWLVVCVIMLAGTMPMIARLAARDPDDFMRLLQVRDLLAGQSWFDVHQTRMNPPFGADMHWSRLVDVPIALCLMAARTVLAEPAASAAAMTAVPLLQLALTMHLLRRLLLALGEGEGTALTAAAIVPLFPLLTTSFLPLRIDHHGWQAMLALWCILELRRPGAAGAWRAGVLAACWLAISLEGLMLVACLCAILALRYLQRREAVLGVFLTTLAAASLVIFIATRPLGQLAQPWCDTIGWPHLLAFATGGAAALALPFLPKQHLLAARLAGLGVVAALGAGFILGGLGRCAIDPFAHMDPLVHALWYNHVSEGLPITAQGPQSAGMLIWTLGIILAGAWAALRGRWAKCPEAWTELALYATASALLSLGLMRAGVAAQLLAVPFSALLLARLFPMARRLGSAAARIIASLACLTMLTPSFASGAGHLLEQMPRDNGTAGASSITPPASISALCDISSLSALPPALLFAQLDLGPEILVRTTHRVVISGYHRNGAAMRDVIEAFSGDPARAEAIIHAHQARYVVLCAADGEAQVMAQRRADNLAHALIAGQPPRWLTPQPGFAGALKVYAIKPQ